MRTCILCKSSEEDDVSYGEMLTKRNVSVHTYCLYLTSNLVQRGKDEEGFLGFLVKDILKEEERLRKLPCCFCKQKYANIGCCKPQCKRSFHLICGIKHGCENQFFDTFQSFCLQHKRKIYLKASENETCSICFELLLSSPFESFDGNKIVRSPCCNSGFFHKRCLQYFAKSSGYFCKCPLCNDKDKFRVGIQKLGVFIPHRDASWELEPNAFAELYERANKCEALNCANPKGRLSGNEFIFCNTCGGHAIHALCLKLETGRKNIYNCSECMNFLNTGNNNENIRNLSTNNFSDQCTNSIMDVHKSINDESNNIDICSIDKDFFVNVDSHRIIANNVDFSQSSNDSGNVRDYNFDANNNSNSRMEMEKFNTNLSNDILNNSVREKNASFVTTSSFSYAIQSASSSSNSSSTNLHSLNLQDKYNTNINSEKYPSSRDLNNISCIARRTRKSLNVLKENSRIDSKRPTNTRAITSNKPEKCYKSKMPHQNTDQRTKAGITIETKVTSPKYDFNEIGIQKSEKNEEIITNAISNYKDDNLVFSEIESESDPLETLISLNETFNGNISKGSSSDDSIYRKINKGSTKLNVRNRRFMGKVARCRSIHYAHESETDQDTKMNEEVLKVADSRRRKRYKRNRCFPQIFKEDSEDSATPTMALRLRKNRRNLKEDKGNSLSEYTSKILSCNRYAHNDKFKIQKNMESKNVPCITLRKRRRKRRLRLTSIKGLSKSSNNEKLGKENHKCDDLCNEKNKLCSSFFKITDLNKTQSTTHSNFVLGTVQNGTNELLNDIFAENNRDDLKISCIELRTRKRSLCAKKTSNTESMKDFPLDMDCRTPHRVSYGTKEDKNVSCIALRTRHKSLHNVDESISANS